MYTFSNNTHTNSTPVAAWIALIMIAAMTVFGLWAGFANAETPENKVTTKAGQLWGCHVPQLDAAVLEKEVYNRRGRQILVVRLDRNFDGSVDMVLIYGSKGTGWETFPIEYAYDIEFKGQPTKAYKDEMGNGICGQMRETAVKGLFEEPKGVPDGQGGEEPSCHADEMDDPKNPKKAM